MANGREVFLVCFWFSLLEPVSNRRQITWIPCAESASPVTVIGERSPCPYLNPWGFLIVFLPALLRKGSERAARRCWAACQCEAMSAMAPCDSSITASPGRDGFSMSGSGRLGSRLDYHSKGDTSKKIMKSSSQKQRTESIGIPRSLRIRGSFHGWALDMN